LLLVGIILYVKYSLDEIIEQPLKAAGIPKEEIPRLLAKISALLCVLSGNMVTPPADSPKPKDDDELLTPEEAAQMLGTTVKWLYAHKRQLPHISLSHKQLRFSRKSLQRYIVARINKSA
jgi:hypothetical protein